MKKLQFIVRFSFQKGMIRITNLKNKWPILLGSAFILSTPSLFAQTKIAFIDTGFCPNLLGKVNIKIEKPRDLTNSIDINCNPKTVNLIDSRYHGQMVLLEFLKFFKPKNPSDFVFIPLIIFDKNGNQSKEYWIKAIKWVEDNNVDLVVTASGFATKEKIVSNLPATWFVSSGRVGAGITPESSLFPQLLAPQKNLFIIGDYYDGRVVLYDQGLIYQDKIDYSFPSGLKGFKGTSRSVAEAAARALLICEPKKMRECLKSREKIYRDNLSRREVTTFE